MTVVLSIILGIFLYSCGYCLAVLFPAGLYRQSIALVLGPVFYTFLVNMLGYVLPISMAFWITLVLMGLAAFFASKAIIPEEVVVHTPLLRRRQWLLLLASTVVVFSMAGVLSLRTLEYDDMALTHLPLAATIEEGNFPVRDPAAPHELVAYHYAPELLSAALATLTAMPLWLAYDIQSTLFTLAIFLLVFSFVLQATGHFGTGLIAAWLVLYAGGINWLYGVIGGFELLTDTGAATPFRFIADMIIPNLNPSLVMAINNHSTAMGFGILLVLLSGLFVIPGWRSSKRSHRVFWFASMTILLAFLALSLETTFALLLALLFGYSGYEFFAWYRTGHTTRRNYALVLLGMAMLAFLLAYMQGGIISTLGVGGGENSFRFVLDFWNVPFADPKTTIWGATFWLAFGFPLLFFLPAWYRYRKETKWTFIGCLALLAFLVPLFVHYPARPWEMRRVFALATPLMGMLIAIYLSGWIFETDRILETSSLESARGSRRVRTTTYLPRVYQGLAVCILVASVMTGLIYQFVFVITPLGHLGNLEQPFLARPPLPPVAAQGAYRWMREQTTLDDYFFPYSAAFVYTTGRFAPGSSFEGSHKKREQEIASYTAVATSCDRTALGFLGIDYFVVDANFPLREPVETCRAARVVLLPVYAGREGEPTIYRVHLDS